MGARLVKDINPAGSSSPIELISINGILFFSAEVGTTVPTEGNSPVDQEETEDSIDSEIETDNPNPSTDNDTAPNGVVALMRSDGSDNGTTILKSFNSVSNLVKSGEKLYFIAGISNEYQLWSSDGTIRGTKQVKDLYPNADPNFPQDLFEIDGVLFYSAIDGAGENGKYPYVNGYEVWRREGEAVGSRFFRNLIPDKIITDITIEKGEEGEADVATVTTSIFENDAFPKDFTSINGNYFFTAQSSAFYNYESRISDTLVGGLELWFSDGTEAGTRPININEQEYSFYEPEDGEYTPSDVISPVFGFKKRVSSSFPRELSPTTKKLYFVANDGISGFELWSISDQGTKLSLISDLNPGNRSSSPEELTIIGRNLYFSADQGDGRKLFYYNNSLNQPKLVKNSGDNPESLTAVGRHLYYSAESELGRELWSAKKANSRMIKDINPGSESSSPSSLTMITRINKVKSKPQKTKYLYFTADDGSHGTELMSINLKNKKNKVNINADLINGPPSSFPRELINHDQQLYFTAQNQSKGRELWTVGPAIQGPTGEPGASSSEIDIFEEQTFVYKFGTTSSQKSKWEINGGVDASRFIMNASNGELSFKSAPKHIKPKDQNKDNIYEIFVRSTIEINGYNSDQLVNISVSDIDEDSGSDNDNTLPDENDSSATNENNSSDEILFYTEQCGPITPNGPLYPCSNTDQITGSGSSGSGSSNSIPTVTGNSNLTNDGKENYNNYNDNVESYNRLDEDCDFASFARFWADRQLDEDDTTLAAHYNNNFSTACDVSKIIF
jgi:ELWxxDGT repeat protein